MLIYTSVDQKKAPRGELRELLIRYASGAGSAPRAASHLHRGGLLCFDGEGCCVLVALIDIAHNVRQLRVIVLHA